MSPKSVSNYTFIFNHSHLSYTDITSEDLDDVFPTKKEAAEWLSMNDDLIMTDKQYYLNNSNY